MKNPFEKPKDNQKAKSEMKTGIGDHDDNLYDEDNDRAGERIDAGTGEWINNSQPATATDEMLHSTVEFGRDESEDVLGSIDGDKNDAAARWLRENDKAA